MNDAVWGYHLNPLTCGVAKFNQQLAARLDLPYEAIQHASRAYPLISVKPSEMPSTLQGWPTQMAYDLFLHDYDGQSARDVTWAVHAKKVFAANAAIAQRVSHTANRDAIEAWCPSLVQGTRAAGAYRVLLFGMAHKRQPDRLRKLKTLLEATHQDYTVEVSTGIHEGSPWDRMWQETDTALRDIFGARLRVLGFLADDALADALAHCHLVAVFFEDGARANNTTLWAALQAGRPVVTNLDGVSPSELLHGRTVLDLAQTRRLDLYDLDAMAAAGRRVVQGRSWARLLSVLMA